MKERTTYAVWYKTKAANYDPQPDWRQYNDWAENIGLARAFMDTAKRNPRFEEIKIVKRTETFEEVKGDE
jgi:hypothetical protein